MNRATRLILVSFWIGVCVFGAGVQAPYSRAQDIPPPPPAPPGGVGAIDPNTGQTITSSTGGGGGVLAAGGGGGVPAAGGGGGVPAAGGGGGVPSTGGSNISLVNPLGNVTIEQFFLKIIDIVLVFAIPIIVIFIMLAGFKYVTANGNTEKIQSATTALTWAVIGGVLILGAKAILTLIQGTITALQ